MNSRSGNLKPLQINNCQTNTATTTTMTLKDMKVMLQFHCILFC